MTVFSAQASQSALGGKATPAATTFPLTAMSIGRFAVPALAYRKASEVVPAAVALTVNSTAEPVVLV